MQQVFYKKCMLKLWFKNFFQKNFQFPYDVDFIRIFTSEKPSKISIFLVIVAIHSLKNETWRSEEKGLQKK